MATTTTKQAVSKPEVANQDEERVAVFIPRGDKGDPNLYVSVNDYTALLPRGKESLVPKFVADEIRRAQEAEESFYRLSEQLESEQ